MLLELFNNEYEGCVLYLHKMATCLKIKVLQFSKRFFRSLSVGLPNHRSYSFRYIDKRGGFGNGRSYWNQWN